MKFTVYSKDGCPFCVQVEQVLEIAGFKNVVYTLDKDFTREEFYAQFGSGSTFPQVMLNDSECLGGCIDTVRYLKENNLV